MSVKDVEDTGFSSQSMEDPNLTLKTFGFYSLSTMDPLRVMDLNKTFCTYLYLVIYKETARTPKFSLVKVNQPR